MSRPRGITGGRLAFTPGTGPGLDHIVDNIGEISRAEYPDLDRDELRDRLAQGPSVMMMLYGKPIGIVGHVPTSPQTRMFWAIYTEAYWAAGITGIRMSRSLMARFLDEWPGYSFESYSWSPHPEVARWMEAIGFQPVDIVAKPKVFVLRR